MSKYIKKPIEVEAFQFGIDEMPEWYLCSEQVSHSYNAYTGETTSYIDTLEGLMKAHKGDYIIKGIKGEIYSCKEDIFKATYDLVETEKDMSKEDKEDNIDLSFDNLNEEEVTKYLKNVSVINIDIRDCFIGENIYLTINDGNKKYFKKKCLRNSYFEVTSYDDLKTKIYNILYDYASYNVSDKVFKKKKEILFNKLLGDNYSLK